MSIGHYTVGRGESCDFILSDSGIESKHLLLFYSEENWLLKPADGKVFIDGKPAPESANPVAPRCIITIGSVHMTLIASHDDWQPMKFPIISQTQAPGSTDTGHQTSSKNTRRPHKMIKVFSMGLALFMVYWMSQNIITIDKPDFDREMDNVRQMLKTTSLTEAKVSMSKDGYIEVWAYAPNKARKDAFETKLQNLNVPSRATIYVEKEIEQMAQSYISMNQYPVRANYKGQGKIHIQGFARDSEEITKIVTGLKENVPGIIQAEQDIHSLGDTLAAVNKILKTDKFEKKIKALVTADGLALTGELQPEEKNVWLQSKNDMLHKIKSDCKIKDQIIYISEQMIKPGKIMVPITSVSLGDKPYVTLQGGRKCFEGGPLKAGAIISRITSEKIIVKIQGREYQYTY